jgi:glycogen debranching enzyme
VVSGSLDVAPIPGQYGEVSDTSPYAGTTPVASLAGSGGPVTLVEDRTFALSDRTGDMAADQAHGLFVLDTRVLSRWEMKVNGHRLETLAVEPREPYATTFAARARAALGHADSDLVVFRRRHVGRGMREELEITNYGLSVVEVEVELLVDADFAGLFEVKEGRVDTGRPRTVHVVYGALWFEGHDGPAPKHVTISLSGEVTIEAGHATWRTMLQPGQVWQTCIVVTVSVDGEQIEPRFPCGIDDGDTVPAARMRQWRAAVPNIRTDHPSLKLALNRSGDDLGALRIFDPGHLELPVIAAGAPWFMTVFGRDSLLTGYMTLLADNRLTHGVLQTLARFQGEDVDDTTEEEPGKILHEMRFGSASGASLERGEVYYGSIDATPLFVMMVGELRRWDPRTELADRLLPHVDRALDWIADFGDRDGDGYVEYQRHSDHGLANQGWKDSWDAVRHADGTLAKPAIALCEVQGYVYAAYVARAHFALEDGDAATFERFRAKALELRRRFNEDFWVDELGTYALALDGDKKPVAVAASNVGHCLWTGIVDRDRAPLVADKLLGDAMFSGWGIRTLSSDTAAYNPASYHNGSVWPHDNAICAAGLMRYGYIEHAQRVITAQLDVAAITQGRLPELFAGFSRRELSVPAAYPTSCSPQAWAAASPLLWLRTLLRLDPWVHRRKMWLAPQLPRGIRRLDVEGIVIGDDSVTLHVEGDRVEVEGASGFEILHEPRPPLTSLLDQDPAPTSP